MAALLSATLLASAVATAAASSSSSSHGALLAPAPLPAGGVAPQVPEQIRLAITADSTSMGVFWATPNSTLDSYAATLQWGPSPGQLTFSAPGSMGNYTLFKLISPSLHFATATGLTHGSTVYYRVGATSGEGWSATYSFTAPPAPGSRSVYPLAFAAYGDMGITHSANTQALVAAHVAAGALDLVLHVGDIGYADNRAGINEGTFYDGVLNDLYNDVMASSSRVPYMFAVGNHEALGSDADGGYLAFRKRVSPTQPWAASGGSQFWGSWEFGPVHFTVFSADQPYAVGTPQHDWILSDLAAVDRTRTPWLIGLVHFPLSCTNYFWCVPDSAPFREALEQVFLGARVNMILAGHVHAGEVLYPTVNLTRVSTSFEGMTVPFQLTTGSPGDVEVCCTDWLQPQPDFSYFRQNDTSYFAYSEITLVDDTHFTLTYWDANNASVVLSLDASVAPAHVPYAG